MKCIFGEYISGFVFQPTVQPLQTSVGLEAICRACDELIDPRVDGNSKGVESLGFFTKKRENLGFLCENGGVFMFYITWDCLLYIKTNGGCENMKYWIRQCSLNYCTHLGGIKLDAYVAGNFGLATVHCLGW